MISSLSLENAKLPALLLIVLSLVVLGGCSGGGNTTPEQDLSRLKTGPTAEDLKAAQAATQGKPVGSPPQAAK